MWILCEGFSILFCIVNWLLFRLNRRLSIWAMISSLTFLILTLLQVIRMNVDWIYKSDWSTLQDVMPEIFPYLLLFSIVLIVFNIIPFFTGNKKN